MNFEAMIFFQENDILEIKINQHWSFIDKFIIVEAGESHTGLKKPFNFDHERFKKYSDKIIYKKFQSFNEEYSKFPELISQNILQAVNSQPHLNTNDWMRDNFQAEYLTKIIFELNPNDSDLILFACVDEIIKPEAFNEAKKRFDGNKFNLKSNLFGNKDVIPHKIDPVFGFDLDLYAYKLNLYSKPTTAMLLTTVENVKTLKHSELRYFSCSTHKPIEKAGWHFTFMDGRGGLDALEKYKSWAHSRDNDPRRKSYFDIQTKEEAEATVFRDYNLEKKPIKMNKNNFPEWLVSNKHKYSRFIFDN